MTRVVRSAAPAPSPWFAISAGILGLVIGYSLVVGPRAAASGSVARCPCADGQCGMQAGNS